MYVDQCVCVRVCGLLVCLAELQPRGFLLDIGSRFLITRLLGRKVAALFWLILPSTVTNTHTYTTYTRTHSEGYCLTFTQQGTEAGLDC